MAINSVLRNTYLLLSLCFFFSAAITYTAVVNSWSAPGPFMMIAGIYGLLFLVQATASSGLGILTCLMFSGFMGYSLAPMLSMVAGAHNGPAIILAATSSTALVFLGLSLYVLTTRKDFSFMFGMRMAATLVAFGLILVNFFIASSAMSLIISFLIATLSSASILMHTSMIVNGGERNYIMATVSLFVALYNLFISLLHIIMMFAGGSRD